MDTNTTTRKVGRPEKPMTWPTGRFTINDLKSTGLSRVTLQLKVTKALAEQRISIVGTDKSTKRMGRPSTVYSLAVV